MMVYLLKSMLCLMTLLLIHRLLLQREVLHRFNRFFLLASVLSSFLIPLYTIEIPAKPVDPVIFEAVAMGETADLGFERFTAEESFERVEAMVEEEQVSVAEAEQSFSWRSILWLVYFVISAVFFIRFLRNLVKLLYQIRVNPHVDYQGETLVLQAQKTAPFSFLKYIFVSRPTFEQEGISDAVFAHERCHVREKHSWDILFIEALLVPLWFHPGLHFARQAIQLNHEFIADKAALNATSLLDYQRELLQSLAIRPAESMVSHLNFSLTKKRLEMMKSNGENPFKWMKILVLVPLMAGIVYVFSDKVTGSAESVGEADLLDSESAHAVTKLKLNGDGTVEVDGVRIESHQIDEAIAALKGKVSQVEFSAEAGVTMGVLADVQEMLRKNDIRRVVYQQSAEVFGSAVLEEHDIYYRNATFLVEDAAGEFVRKDYEQLSADEKSYLVSSPKAPALISPTAEMWEAWSDSQKYSFWLDGERITVEKLAGISPAEIIFYFSSFMSPEVYHVRLFTADGYENTFGSKSGFGSPLVEDDRFYIYPLSRRVNYGTTIVKSRQSPVDMYLRLYHDYSSRFDGKGDDDLSEWEQAIGWQYFTELGGRFFRLSAANKKLVPRAKRPSFQYWVPLKKDGIRYYKKQNELTEEEKKQLPPPPPPTSAQEGASTDKKEPHYREAVFLIESEGMEYTRKNYQQLSRAEKDRLMDAPKPMEVRYPTQDQLKDWSDSEKYAVWMDGKVIPNEAIGKYSETYFVYYFQSPVLANARSERFPQPFQVYLYTQVHFDSELGPDSHSQNPLTESDTITLTSRGIWYKDLQRYPDPVTAYLQKYSRYENLRTSGAIDIHKAAEEKNLLGKLYDELTKEYTQLTDTRRKSLRTPIAPDSDTPINGSPEQKTSGKIQLQRVSAGRGEAVTFKMASSGSLESKALQKYLRHYGAYQTKAHQSRFGSQKSNAELEALLAEYRDFGDLYAALSIQERMQVSRPTFPYARLGKDGVVSFKRFEDLTSEEQKELNC
jgi:biopolymer transport protein ExbD